jgi:HAD superfamily hydrolase (TIGR01490 family)
MPSPVSDDQARSNAAHDRADPGARVIAFFDVDNTLMRGASIYHLGRAAWRRGFVGWRDIARFGWHQARFIAVGENHRHQVTVRDRALELVAGHTEAELEILAAETYDDRVVPLLLPDTVALAHDHLARGHDVWLITATPERFATIMAERLGLTGAIASRIESVDGVFTGRLLGPVMHGAHKADAAAALAAQKGVSVRNCWAYSDSRNDIPLLELVGHRTVVNPDAALLRYARARGWPVLHARP